MSSTGVDAPPAAGTRSPTRACPAAAPASGSRADATVRQLLRVPECPARPVSEEEVQRVFSISILLSAFRCLLSYIILPIVTPLLGAATNIGPAIGIPVAVVALVFDAMGIRRFWMARHRWRWAMTFVYLAVMGMVSYLLAGDISHFA